MALRLMDFVTENQVEKEKELFEGGPRLAERASANERPLYEILKENRDKKDAEFTEKFKHRPPKALDDDETEFLEAVEMHKRELESKQKEEEDEQLLNFQAALASRTVIVEEPRVFVNQPKEVQELPRKNKQPVSGRTLPISVKFKLVPKKAKVEPAVGDQQAKNEVEQKIEGLEADGTEVQKSTTELSQSGLLGLSSYSDDTDDDE
ncbi:unnamed protein product [Calypogeia fissa]